MIAVYVRKLPLELFSILPHLCFELVLLFFYSGCVVNVVPALFLDVAEARFSNYFGHLVYFLLYCPHSTYRGRYFFRVSFLPLRSD